MGFSLDLGKKLVVVTGGANGIGRAISLAFVEEGAHVACLDIDPAAGDEITKMVPTQGNLTFIQMDASQADLAPVVESAVKWHTSIGGAPGVDVLVNNVGIQIDNGKPAHLLPVQTWDTVMHVNLRSYFLMSQLCLPGMLAQKRGVIINIASVQGAQSQVGIPAYAASKGGILSLTRQMACDYSNQGVRVLSLSPGSVLTPLVKRLIAQDGQTAEELGAKCPRGTMAHPQEVADAVLFLASSKAANFTGADITCDGGLMAMGSWDKRVGFPSYTSKL